MRRGSGKSSSQGASPDWADASFLHAADGGYLGLDDALVDAPTLPSPACGGGKGGGVVGHLDGLVIGLEAVERATGPKVSSWG
jgi:hypothetical protein